MAELIERDLLCHSLNQHLRQGLCKGDEKMNCAMTGLNPYSFMKGFEYGMQLAQTIVCNRPTMSEAEIRAKAYNMAIDDFTDRLRKKCDSVIREEWNHNTQPTSWADAYEDFKDDIDEIAESLKIICILEQSG